MQPLNINFQNINLDSSTKIETVLAKEEEVFIFSLNTPLICEEGVTSLDEATPLPVEEKKALEALKNIFKENSYSRKISLMIKVTKTSEELAKLKEEVFKRYMSVLDSKHELKILDPISHESRYKILKPYGTSIILNYLSEIRLENNNTFICESLEKFIKILIELDKSDFVGKQSYLVMGRDTTNFQNLHQTAVLVERTNNFEGTYDINIVISDSLGDSSYAKKVKWEIPTNLTNSVLITEPKKQTDLQNFPIFALHDVRIFHSTENFLKDFSVIKTPWGQEHLPSPELMKLTQSLAFLSSYNYQRANTNHSIVNPHNQEKYKLDINDKLVNVRADIRMIKYTSIIVDCMEKSAIPAERFSLES